MRAFRQAKRGSLSPINPAPAASSRRRQKKSLTTKIKTMAFPTPTGGGSGGGALPIISGGAGLIGDFFNRRFQRQENQKQWDRSKEGFWMEKDWERDQWHRENEYNEGLWNKQNTYNEGRWQIQNDRDDSIWDRNNKYNEGRWDIENKYNSPAEQMKRYKEAGLNPNLIYGQSNTGGSISAGPQGSNPTKNNPQSSASAGGGSGPTYRGIAPTLNLNDALSNYVQFREASARTNNLETQNRLIDAQTINTIVDASKKGVETHNLETLLKYQIDGLEAEINKKNIERIVTQNRDAREAQINPAVIKKLQAETELSETQLKNAMMDNEFKQYDMQLRNMGIHPGSPAWLKALGGWIHYQEYDKDHTMRSKDWD